MTTSACDCPLAAICGDLHAMAEAIHSDRLDTAIEIGLLDYVSFAHRPDIAADALCAPCIDRDRLVSTTRDARLRALAARERFRAREARLHERAHIRAEKRASDRTASTSAETMQEGPSTLSLPAAAAAALARAKAKVAAKNGDGA
jgi:Na+-translocating ferredoxin:NAD+ oxidoreductase RnfC subunit